jgi:hypothetical protein
MLGRDFKWMVGLILVVASASLFRPSPPSLGPHQPLQVKLQLGADAQFTQKFELTLNSNESGAGFDTLLTVSGFPPPFDHHGAMDRPTFEKLEQSMVASGLWTISSADESGPEETMLYTWLTARQGGREHSSRWRGLPTPQHRELANCFMQSPAGDSLREALEALLAAKK